MPYYLPIPGGRIIEFIPFPRVFVLWEMKSVSSRIWTRAAVSISYDDNHYTTGTSENSGVLTSLLLPQLLSSLTDSLPSLNLLCHSKTDAWFMQDAPKAVWNISYAFQAFYPSLKQNSIAYRSSKVSSRPVCIVEIHQLGQSGFSRVYSNCCCSYSFEPEIIKIGQSSYKIYSNNLLNSQESTLILNAHTKNVVCSLHIA